MRRAGSVAWAGLLNTRFWVDPTSGATYTQFLPFVPEEALAMYADFERALYSSPGGLVLLAHLGVACADANGCT